MDTDNKTRRWWYMLGGILLAGGVLTITYVLTASVDSRLNPVHEPERVVTDCYESRESYGAVTRVENAVPEFGYPNVKCSPRSGRVLWYGDPFDGTIPMGDMPALPPDDPTHADFTNAVVRPREQYLQYYNMDAEKHCEACHNGEMVPFPTDNKPRALGMHQDIVENALDLQHGRGKIWCLDCHSAQHRNKLVDFNGNLISFNQPQKLCGKCHGQVYGNWRKGIHGKRIGSWKTGGKKRWWVCTECHNPHTVQVHRFDPISPEAPPELTRGMEKVAHEIEGRLH